MSRTKNQSARTIQMARRSHEADALVWLGLSQKCGNSTGAREMHLALAALAMDAADACVVPVEGEYVSHPVFSGWDVVGTDHD